MIKVLAAIGAIWLFFQIVVPLFLLLIAAGFGIASLIKHGIAALVRRWKPRRPVEKFMAKLSFVIPAFNEEKLIVSTVMSIRVECTGAVEHEIIVVDNGSTDNTAKLAAAAGARVVHEERKGVVFARQRGFEEAKYPLVCNIDADSALPKGWLKAALRPLDNPKVCAVTGPLYYYDLPLLTRALTLGYYVFAVLAMKTLGASLQGGNCIIRRDDLVAIGGYDTAIEFYGEDTMTAKRLKGRGKIKFVPRMRVLSSGRRLSGQGIFRTGWLYTLNYLSITLCSRSKTHTYEDFR